MFLFGMLNHGPHGLEYLTSVPEENIGDIMSYGIDWVAQDDPVLMGHLLGHNPQDWEEDNPFQSASLPSTMSEVVCEAPNCPLTQTQCALLAHLLDGCMDRTSQNMQVRKLVWIKALVTCRGFYQ
jgi:hypothetical protein